MLVHDTVGSFLRSIWNECMCVSLCLHALNLLLVLSPSVCACICLCLCVLVQTEHPQGSDMRRTVNSTDLSYSNPSPFCPVWSKIMHLTCIQVFFSPLLDINSCLPVRAYQSAAAGMGVRTPLSNVLVRIIQCFKNEFSCSTCRFCSSKI